MKISVLEGASRATRFRGGPAPGAAASSGGFAQIAAGTVPRGNAERMANDGERSSNAHNEVGGVRGAAPA
jgi:hypothetical protein